MKVLHVAPAYARIYGGPSEVLRGLLPALIEEGVQVRLLTTDKGVDSDERAVGLDVPMIVTRSRHPMSWSFATRFRKPLRDWIEWADVIHIHSLQTYTSTQAMRWARKIGKPYLVEPHGSLNTYHLAQRRTKKILYSHTVDRKNLIHLNGFICSSQSEMKDAAARYRRPTFLMTLGVDPALFSVDRSTTIMTTTSTPKVLFLGRVTHKKRLDLLLRALAQPPLVDLDAHLIVAGPIDPELPYSPATMAADLGVANRTHFVGVLNPQQRSRLLGEVSVFALPSEDESFGMAVAEALAAGCPTVCSTHVGVAPSAAASGVVRLAGLNADEVANAIAGVLTRSAEQLQALQQSSRAYALREFTWRKAASDAISTYRDVLASETPAS